MIMASADEWIVLATIPPAAPDQVDELATALTQAHIENQIEQNSVRLCKNDVAVWLRVRPHDVARATDLAHLILSEET